MTPIVITDEASYRAAADKWEGIEYYLNAAEEFEDGEYDRLVERQIEIERAMADHQFYVNENDEYVKNGS